MILLQYNNAKKKENSHEFLIIGNLDQYRNNIRCIRLKVVYLRSSDAIGLVFDVSTQVNIVHTIYLYGLLLPDYSPLRSKTKIILNENRVFISDDEETLLSQLFNKSHQTYLQFFQIKLELIRNYFYTQARPHILVFVPEINLQNILISFSKLY